MNKLVPDLGIVREDVSFGDNRNKYLGNERIVTISLEKGKLIGKPFWDCTERVWRYPIRYGLLRESIINECEIKEIDKNTGKNLYNTRPNALYKRNQKLIDIRNRRIVLDGEGNWNDMLDDWVYPYTYGLGNEGYICEKNIKN